MPNATFILKEPTSNTQTLVYLIYRFDGHKLKYSTRQKIHPKFWNEEKQRAKETRQFPGYAEFNSILMNLESLVNNRFRNLINDKTVPTPENLRLPLDEFLCKDNTKSIKDVVTFAEDYVINSNRKPGTKRQLRQAIRNLKEFKSYSKRILHFESIDLDFYDDYVKYLIEVKQYGTNTIGTLIKNLKLFMNEAVDRKLTNNVQYRNRRFKTMEESSENIYLTTNDIQRIYAIDLQTLPRLERVRDSFIIACYTGLRFSDLKQLKTENLIDDWSKIRIKTEKTGELVIIPLHSYVKEILKKYDGSPPQILSNQKMNEYLKEVGERAGIDENVMINSTKGGVKVNESFKKFELITTHTARRSFATNAFLNNVPTISIMKITGHRTEKSFMKYIKISQEDNANKLILHPFFN
ncbi:site-specific integrase [Pollutibacter soli]|uniref:site-specific integrase n=1 Tax=Pollutibacter soli TaxID=3034157 RepID=UPI00301331D6